jgi:hypothetical protein
VANSGYPSDGAARPTPPLFAGRQSTGGAADSRLERPSPRLHRFAARGLSRGMAVAAGFEDDRRMGPAVRRRGRRDGAELRRAAGANPLRRRGGRIRVAAWTLAVPAVLGLSATAIAVGVWVFDSVHDPDLTVTATTARQAFLLPADRYTAMPRWVVPVAWSERSGKVHRGTVKVSSRLSAGVAIPVGLAPDGSLRHQPPPVADAWVRAAVTGLAVEAVGGAAVWSAVSAARRAAERTRLGSWDTAWAQWDGHLPGRNGGR